MKKFLLGLVAGFLLAALGAVIVVFALLRAGDRRPAVAANSVLVLRLEGSVPELAPVTIPLPMFESQAPATVAELWSTLRAAARDTKIKALVLEPRGVVAGWAKLDEIRAGIAQFKASGKPVYAYLRTPGAREYYLATAADRVYFSQEDYLDLKGMRAELTYYRGTFDKLGIEFEIEHAGKYKDALDSYTRTSPTPETREVTNSILDQVFGHLVDTIAQARRMPAARVRALIDDGPFLARKALAGGLVDGLLFDDQVYEEVNKKAGHGTLRKISHRDYLRAVGAGSETRNRIALVVGEGAITRGGESDPLGEEEGIRSGAFVRLLRQVADDGSIRGVILRVNSPGGDSIASDEILHEVRRLSRRKPTVISMSDMAASGGYYISMTGDPVVAYPNTFTGSIGVIFGKPNVAGLYRKLGITTETIQRGRYADIDSPSRPMTPEARRKLKEGIQSTYDAFLARVAEGRKKKTAEIEPLAQGRVWMGAQAKGNGLVDELGGLDRAVELVRKRANIGAGERIRLVPFPARRSLWEQLFSSDDRLSEAALERLAMRRRIADWTSRLRLESIEPLLDPELWVRGGAILRLAPYSIRVE